MTQLAAQVAPVSFVIWTVPGSVRHEQLLDAFLVHAGFAAIEDRLCEVLYVVPENRDRYRWVLRFARCEGAA